MIVETPIDVKQLSDAKEAIEKAADLRDKVARVSVGFVKAMRAVEEVSMAVEMTEEDLNTKLIQILNTHNVKQEDFRGWDWDRGMIRYENKLIKGD